MNNVGIIGAGKVGVTFGKYFFNKGESKLIGYYSRSIESSNYAAKVTNSARFNNLEKLVKKCNILIIATSDDQIKDAWSELSKYNIQNKIIGHCSGSLSSDIFFDISSKGAFGCSFHPLLAINSKEESYKELKNAFFTLEGDKIAVDFFENILKENKNEYKVINSCDKTRYHVSSVFLSNLVVALGSISIDLLKEYGFSDEEGIKALSSLASGNMSKLLSKGPIESLTGPVERNDYGTVEKHIKSLSEEEYDRINKLYRLLSLELVDIASKKNKDRNYDKIRDLLLKGEHSK